MVAEIPVVAAEEQTGPSVTMEEVSKGMIWHISPSTLSLFASDDWSLSQGDDQESNAEKSPQGTEDDTHAACGDTNSNST